MTGTVHQITRDTDVDRITTAAAALHDHDTCDVAANLRRPARRGRDGGGEPQRPADVVGRAGPVVRGGRARLPDLAAVVAVRWEEVEADERLIDALRSGAERADGDRLDALLAAWRDEARREGPAFASPAAVSGLESVSAGDGPGKSIDLVRNPLIHESSAAGPEAATRSGGDPTPRRPPETAGERVPGGRPAHQPPGAAVPEPLNRPETRWFLRVLADHLEAHPDLIDPYGVTGLDDAAAGWEIHIQLTDSTRSSFTRWAEAVDGGEVTVKPPLNREHGGRIARVHGRIGGFPVQVYDGRVTWGES